MALVNMKCPNCGGVLQQDAAETAQFECPYCHATVLNILDVKVEGDIEKIDADEFVRRLNEQKKKFVIRVDRQYKVVDVRTAVINGKLEQAEKHLSQGNFSEAIRTLDGVPADIPAAARILFLAANGCVNEYELALGGTPLREKSRLSVFDEETAASYRKIEEIRAENGRIVQEIREGYTLMNGGIFLIKEAYSYALNMCGKYPSSPHAWKLLGDVKSRADSSYGVYSPSKEKVIAQELTYAMRKGLPGAKPPEVSSSECRKDFLLCCAQCGNIFTPATAAFACPACGHEQSNDDIQKSLNPGMRERAEACKAEYERTFCIVGPRRYRNGMIAMLLLSFFVLFIELVVSFNSAGDGVSLTMLIIFGVFNALFVLCILLILLRYFGSRGKLLRRHAELAATLRTFGIYRWSFYNKAAFFPCEQTVDTAQFPAQFRKASLPFFVLCLLASLPLILWTLSLIFIIYPA